MMRNEFVLFLKKYNLYDEEIYRYYLDNANRFDYYNENEDCFLRYLIGCEFHSKRGRLERIVPFVPYPVDDVTTLINIYEYVHLFMAYNKLGKKYKTDIYEEVLPKFYEKLFAKDKHNLSDYERKTDEIILKSGEKKYLLALKISEYLLNSYNNESFEQIRPKVKKIGRKLSKK